MYYERFNLTFSIYILIFLFIFNLTTGSIQSFFSKKNNLVSTSTSTSSSSSRAILSSNEHFKSIENITSTACDKFQSSESLNTSSKILSKLESVNCEKNVSLEKTAIDNAEYEKERILNMSVLYGYPASKISKITPKKASKFFKKTSLAIVVTKNIERTDIDYNRTNTEINFTPTTVTSNNHGNNLNNNINNNINNHNHIKSDNDHYDNHNKNKNYDYNNDNNDSEYDNVNTSDRSQNVKNDNNHYLNLMQYQSNSCHSHESNAPKVTRTYDEYMFQAIDGEISQQLHTNINSTALITTSNLQTDEEISAAEIENKNENKNENRNENKNEKGNKTRCRSNDKNKNENKIVCTNDESRKVMTTNSFDSDNDVEVIVPYQTPIESTLTHADEHAHTRHVDRTKRVIERTEHQTVQKKRLVGSSKPFSRSGKG